MHIYASIYLHICVYILLSIILHAHTHMTMHKRIISSQYIQKTNKHHAHTRDHIQTHHILPSLTYCVLRLGTNNRDASTSHEDIPRQAAMSIDMILAEVRLRLRLRLRLSLRLRLRLRLSLKLVH